MDALLEHFESRYRMISKHFWVSDRTLYIRICYVHRWACLNKVLMNGAPAGKHWVFCVWVRNSL